MFAIIYSPLQLINCLLSRFFVRKFNENWSYLCPKSLFAIPYDLESFHSRNCIHFIEHILVKFFECLIWKKHFSGVNIWYFYNRRWSQCFKRCLINLHFYFVLWVFLWLSKSVGISLKFQKGLDSNSRGLVWRLRGFFIQFANG